MTGVSGMEGLTISREDSDNIQEITKRFVMRVNPLKVILFGSFANGSYDDDSDYDFYIVVDDGRNVGSVTDEAYRAVMDMDRRSVDIVVGTNSRYERKGKADYSLMVEGEVERNGILLYNVESATSATSDTRAFFVLRYIIFI